MPTAFDFDAIGIEGANLPLSQFRGSVLLVVNVASRCGFTPQYHGLERLYRQYRGQGFSVLGFPCDQFGHQEPGSERDIQQFCRETFDVSFPLFSKVAVNGPDAHPLFQFLKEEGPGLLRSRAIKWNFTKFLIGRDGHVRQRFGPAAKPESLTAAIEDALAQPEASGAGRANR